mmetsp:Transcript_48340/g.117071  ORF Transcript_48340/g.117071 Transcript_48340/m.117071 type:complete len:137 (+) Transcript_48340:47-457(+)
MTMENDEQHQKKSIAAAVADLNKYIADFNSGNLDGVTRSLDENVEVYLDGNLAAKGRATILPSYSDDFKTGKQVSIVGCEPKGTVIQDDGLIVKVAVVLKTVTPQQPTMLLDVVYSYDPNTVRQVRHEITNVRREE